MADAPTSKIHITVVTPEKAILDEYVDSVTLPMFDGERGVLPRHSPFVGQLGYGMLRLDVGGTTRSFYIDGGFAQVSRNEVTLLTAKAMTHDELTTEHIDHVRRTVEMLPTTTMAERSNRQKATERVSAMTRTAMRMVPI